MHQKPRKTLDRELGLASVMAVSMGAMLGSGIFVLPGLAVLKAGNSLALAYVTAALIVLPAALAKCEMATALPRAGGTYLYVDRSVGPLAGTVVGLGTWFSLVFKSAFALIGLGAYAKHVFPGIDDHTSLAVAVCAGLILLNLLGVKKTSKFQTVVVAIALVGLTAFAAAAAPRVDTARYAGMFGIALKDLFATAGFVFVAFAGVTKVASVAEEVRDPDRNIPLGILVSLGIVTGIYVVISTIVVGAEPHEAWGGDATPLATISGRMWGSGAAAAMAVLALLTLTSMANSGLMSSSRFPLAMARDRLFPDFLARINQRFRTPAAAILLTGILMATLIRFVPVRELAKLASAFKLILFAMVNVSLIFLRESGARWYKPSFRIPLYPVLPVAGVIGTGALLFTMGPLAWVGAGGIVGGGLLWYAVYARRRVTRRGAVARLVGARRRLSRRVSLKKRSGVVVPVFEQSAELDELLPFASMVCDRAGKLLVLRVEEVADQLWLTDADALDPITSQIAARVEALEERQKLAVDFEAVVTHHADHVLYERAEKEGANWVVMGWPARSQWRWFVPDPLAWFIHHPPCNLLLFREGPGNAGEGITRFQRVLVLAEPGPHDTLVVSVADRLAQRTGADLTFAYLASPTASDDELAGLRAYHRSLDPLFKTVVGDARIVQAADELEAALALTREFDLLILGAPPQNEAHGLLRGSFEDRVTEGADCAVLRVMALRGLPHSSLHRAPTSAIGRAGGGHVRLPEDPGFRLAEHVVHVAIVRDGTLRTKAALFQAIGQEAEERLGRSLERSVEELLWERENRQVTALGHGVAIPHLTSYELDDLAVELWLLDPPVDFGGHDTGPIDVCFVILAPPAERGTHLRALGRIGQLSLSEGLLEQLRSAGGAEEAIRILREGEAALE